ncbi:uncharacterized protein PFLUO_LOCUS9542 [Penicillium psychrofluorescens]|uniref:uncharacterized protein n=1 Tax=Penicillium psychrofluorescens TaxID=3158075 RepID=UPI003CCD9704
MGPEPLSSRGPLFEVIQVAPDTNVDIVAVPAIGADHRKAWTPPRSRCWLETDSFQHMPRARVLLYDQGELHDGDTLDVLGRRFLHQLLHERKHSNPRRPIFFICHSTGGLVVKQALALAARPESHPAILTSCHGIAFLATPHQGSTYLSADEYEASIGRLLHLRQAIPRSVRDQLRPRQQGLWHLSNQFKAMSADMKVWTFLETVDSTLRIVDTESANSTDFHAPITSIRSGLLDIEHEKEVPMATDHAGTASFQGQESALESFLTNLGSAVTTAVMLSREKDTPLEVEKEVMIQVNGFFEDPSLGVSDETPLKLWSTNISLEEYLTDGPSACLRDRLKRASKRQSGGFDDSSLSSHGTRHSVSHIPVPETGHLNEPESHHEERPSRPPLIRQSHSFAGSGPQSPEIHITGPLNRETSESPPPPAARKRQNSITRALNPLLFKYHKRTTSDSSSQTGESSSRPPSQSGFLSIPISTRDRINQDVESSDIPRSVPRFDRPEPDTEKLLWIHVPYTHTGWVSQVIRQACHDRHEPDFLRKFVNEENWYSNLNRARHSEPHARFVRPKCIHSRHMDDLKGTKAEDADDPQLALYVPYLHWDTYRNLIQRRKVVEQRLAQGRTIPVPSRISQSSQEAQLIWKYLGCEPPVHFRRTLDQFGYPNLRSTVARDDDQMLWKRTRKTVRVDDQLREYLEPQQGELDDSDAEEFMDGKVLMVDQLWLWIVDEKTIVTFFPNQEATTSEGKLYEQSNLHSSIYNELNGDLARRFDTAGDLAALIVLHAVTVLLDKTLHHDLQVLRIFEESISILTESVTKSFKRFRNRGFTNRPADHNRLPSGKIMTATQRDQRDRKVAQRNREDLSVLLELRDIEDELSTLLKLLDQQETVSKRMVEYFEAKGYGKMFLDTAMSRLGEYRSQIGEMKENSHDAQKAVETLLDLKQKQANVDESKMTRWQAEVTQNQSRAVMVFTIFTVIFLPLSFFTSLFGINAREWSGIKENLSLNLMFEIAAPASVALIAFTLLMAFSENLREAVSKSHKIGTGFLREFLLHPIRTFFRWDRLTNRAPSVVVPEDSAMRKRLDQYLGYESHNTKLDEDIWENWQADKDILSVLYNQKTKPKPKPITERVGERMESLSEKVRQMSESKV